MRVASVSSAACPIGVTEAHAPGNPDGRIEHRLPRTVGLGHLQVGPVVLTLVLQPGTRAPFPWRCWGGGGSVTDGGRI